ncbi:transglutaminase-like putative cysteine protease [Sphingomonas naasensis]|uniref:Transglutaminase family protein n=1 Tax=Sphingomonas naasensis TaxID=1344951 RepID=A0A4S1W908_9SPHN|nr:transglutaminase family protein [Sphingomonas naasensis]NIJ19524.1 transglutaminase-like putative cysteine protease [Sphingomonas naasensis]TGX39259.1 transglutaminase family protein [Sphingomonas naasensis]
MRIAIDHRTRYRFTEPQARIVQMLRLTPCDTRDQTAVSWMISVDCDARMRDAVDGFGNAVTMLYAEGPIAAIDISVTGEVLTVDSGGVVHGSSEPLPPMLYLRTTPRTTLGDGLPAFAAESIAGARDSLERLHRLNAALHARFPCLPDAPDTGLTAAEAFESGRATSRDAAQMFIAAARGLEMPARYVSGYRIDGGAQSAPHAWAEAYVEGLGWVGFDPVTGLSPDQGYVRVAVGLDAHGAASIAGTRIGAGDEKLDVALRVSEE